LALEVETIDATRFSCCCENKNSLFSESNSIHEGIGISSSTSEWSENDNLSDFGSLKGKDILCNCQLFTGTEETMPRWRNSTTIVML